jgi:type VI secretion system protein ImpC
MSDDGWTPDFGTLDRSPRPGHRSGRCALPCSAISAPARPTGRLDTGEELARRKAIPVEFDTLEDTLARLQVKLNLPIGDAGAGVEVEFADLDAFHPDTLYQNLDMFRALGDLRKRLNNTATFAKAAAEVKRCRAARCAAPRAAGVAVRAAARRRPTAS